MKVTLNLTRGDLAFLLDCVTDYSISVNKLDVDSVTKSNLINRIDRISDELKYSLEYIYYESTSFPKNIPQE